MLGLRRGPAASLAAVSAALSTALLGLAWTSPADAATSGQVYVLQGIAGQTLSVVVDDRSVAASAAPRTVVGPLSLSPGSHTVQLVRGSAPIAKASFTVKAGSSTDLVAHRFPDASRAPTVTAFPNDLSPVPPGKTRLLVAHTAVVPPADILVNGSVLISNVANGESSTHVVPAGSYAVAIVPAATKGPAVLGPTTLKIKAGTLTNVFAIGDPTAGTMDAIVQSLPVSTRGSAAPSKVNTGDGGQAAWLFSDGSRTSGAMSVPGRVALLFGILAVLGATAVGASRRGSISSAAPARRRR